MSLSRAQRRELNLVSEGLAIGCISLGLNSVSSDSGQLTAALQHSWERWPHAHKFPALSRGTLRFPEVLCEEMVRQNRRTRSLEHAFWRRSSDGLLLYPVKTRPQPSVEVLLHGQEQTTVHWEGLAAAFIKHMNTDAGTHPPVALPPG